MGPKNYFVAVILAIALAAGIFVAVRMQAPAELRTAFVLPAPTALPEFELIDHSGETIGRDAFRGHWSLVFFGFTHCPDICPTTLHLLSSAKKTMAENGQPTLPRIVLVSVDPERDTPDLMAQYLGYFGEGNLGITGSVEGVETLTKALGIFFEKQPGENGNYGVDHSAAVLVVNPQAEFHALFSGSHQIENFVHDMPLIMAAY